MMTTYFFTKISCRTVVRHIVLLSLLSALPGLTGCHPQGNGNAAIPATPIGGTTSQSSSQTPAVQTTAANDGLAPPDADKVTFTDITEQAGIRWQHFSGARGKKYMPECETPGCAFLDYNNDGRPDILLLNGADWPEVKTGRKHSRMALYRNDGNGHFTDVTKQAGLDIEMHSMGVAVGDYDNDGYDDIYITCILGPSRLFHNDGHGHFMDVTQQAGVDNKSLWGTSAAWVDYDRDGKLDLVVGNYCKWTPKTDAFCSVYQHKKSYCTPSVYDGESLRLYHNLGNGKFADVTTQAGIAYPPGKTWGFAILDYDGDGWPDIAVANDLEPNCLFHNLKNGTFKEEGMMTGVALGENGAARAGMGIDTADVDNSGRESILISNFAGEGLSFFYNTNGQIFQELSGRTGMADASSTLMGWGLFFFDYDLDGRKDALVCNGHLYDNVQQFQPQVHYAETPLLFHNMGALRFAETAKSKGDLAHEVVARGCSYADIDGDGDLDVLIMTLDGKPHLLRNDGGNRNHWLRVQLVGKKSNRDGYSAKIVVTAAGVTQMVRVRSGSSFLSALEKVATVGLGTKDKADSVQIVWPSGQTDTYTNVGADVRLIATEGEGAVACSNQDIAKAGAHYVRHDG